MNTNAASLTEKIKRCANRANDYGYFAMAALCWRVVFGDQTLTDEELDAVAAYCA